MKGNIAIKGRCIIRQVLSLEMKQQANEHGILNTTFWVEADMVKDLFEMKELEFIEITLDDLTIFKGLLKKIEVVQKGNNYYEAELSVISSSWLLDKEKKNKSFQNIDITYESIIEGIVPFISMEDINKKINCPVLQFEETDWEFVKRMSSRMGFVVYPNCKSTKAMISVGLPGSNECKTVRKSHYKVGTDERYKQNILPDIDKTRFLYYEFSSNEFYDMGAKINLNEKEGNVYDIKAKYVNGEMIFTYRIGKKALYTTNKIKNYNIIGRSIIGKVIKTEKQTVKVHLDIDTEQDVETAYPYIWAPDSGNLLYCMPQKGTKVALYFGDTDDVPAKLIHCIRTNGDNCPKFSNPQIKRFTTEHNKGIILGTDMIEINTDIDAEKSSKIIQNDAKDVEIITNKSISMVADGKIRFAANEMNICSLIDISLLFTNGIISDGTIEGTGFYGIRSGFEIDNEVNIVAEGNVFQQYRKHLKYPPINDEPEEFDEKEWRKNIAIGILAAVAAAALVAGAIAFCIGTGGAGVGVLAAIGAGFTSSSLPAMALGGGILLGSALTINNACADAKSGEVSSTATYIKSGFAGGFVGAIMSAASAGLMAECTLLTQKFLLSGGIGLTQTLIVNSLTYDPDNPPNANAAMGDFFISSVLSLFPGGTAFSLFLTALADAAGVDIDGSGDKKAIDVIIGDWLEDALEN